MKISRVWAMPSKYTFLIKPVAELLGRYVGDGKEWIDPFAGANSPAEITNDINPKMSTIFHMEALDFIQSLKGHYKGALFDPPYSLEQLKRSYENIGRVFTMRDGQIANRWAFEKAVLSNKIVPNGIVISFGWNSNGMGKKRGFELLEILLVCHGAGHNDTICVVERKSRWLWS